MNVPPSEAIASDSQAAEPTAGDDPQTDLLGWIAIALCTAATLILALTWFVELSPWGYVIGLSALAAGMITLQFGRLPKGVRRFFDWWPFP